MFNLEWLKNLIKREPELSLDDRIRFQVQNMHEVAMANLHTLARGHNDRLKILEARSERVDAFYVKTVTQALGEKLTGIQAQANQNNKDMSAIRDQLNTAIEGAIYRIDNLVGDIQKERARVDATNSRLAALVSKLRAGLE